MKRICLIGLLTWLGFNVQAEAPIWQWAIGGIDIGHSKLTGMAVTATGEVIITGAFSNTLQLDTISLTSAGYEDVFIAKLTAGGRVLWARCIGGTQHETPAGIAFDETGNIYVGGSFEDSIIVGNVQLRSRGVTDIFLAKYDKNGSFGWVMPIGSPGYDYVGLSVGGVGGGISVDGRGHIYVTGSYGSNAQDTGYFGNLKIVSRGESDIFLAKCDTAGNFLWVKSAGGISSDFSSDVKVDKKGNVYICGSFDAPWAYFDTTKIFTKQGQYVFGDIFTAKYDSTGKMLWVKGAGNTSSLDGAGSLDLDSNANVYVTGGYGEDYLLFDNYTMHGSNGGNGIFTCKYDTNGNLVWAKGAGGYLSSGVSITCDKGGNSYITGQTSMITIFDNDSLNGSTLFVTKYNKDGVVQWVSGNGGSGGGDGYAIACNKSTGDVYLGGYYGGSAMSMGSVVFPATNVASMFVAKMSIATTGISRYNHSSSIRVWPQPSHGYFLLSAGTAAYSGLSVSDAAGRIVYETDLPAGRSEYYIRLPASITDGLYYLRLTGSNDAATGKILISR